ncbi:MAG: VOC family protein [Xanthobacteraceae bacterium]|nr:VOC family protein [Xanthobacteraceae bacterium]
MKVIPYLFFNGTCEDALNFYEKTLGAKAVFMMRYKDMPAETGHSPEVQAKIAHVRFTIGDDVIMASDAPPDRFNKPQGFDINLSIATPEEADRIFAALSEGAQAIHMPIAETFWAHRFGSLVDKFGIPWMVNCEKKM